jgi:hypothetical protein
MDPEERREYEEELRNYELQHGAKRTAMERIWGAAGTVQGVAQRMGQRAQDIANSPAAQRLRDYAQRMNEQDDIGGSGTSRRSGYIPINPGFGGNQGRPQQAAGQPMGPAVGNPAGSGVFVMQGKMLAAPLFVPAGLRPRRGSGMHHFSRGGLGHNEEDRGLSNDHL